MINNQNVTHYLFTNTSNEGHISHNDYIDCPGTAFLKFCLGAKDSIEFCKQHFPKHAGNNRLTAESYIKIQHIVNSTLALIMGNFETYQKYLFAGTFERTIHFDQFDSSRFFKAIGDKEAFKITPNHLLGYRSEPMTAGILVADNTSSWHYPDKVNEYFRGFGFDNLSLFSNDDISDLKIIWQLRHSIVHTAATITRADAQKVSDLKDFSGKNIILTNKFIYEFVKRLHSLVYGVNNRLRTCVENRLKPNLSPQDKSKIIKFYDLRSQNAIWLR